MPEIVGKIPEFTSDESQEEVKAGVSEETTSAETDTPSESSSENEPVGEVSPEPVPAETPPQPTEPNDEVVNQLNALQLERTKLLNEIVELRGTKRELKKEELFQVQEDIKELEGVNPEDVTVVEKIIRAKGFITKEESSKMFYDSVKQEQLTKFLERYPEYKPENDPNDVNWQTLQREMGYYKMPSNPHQIGEVLERAHKMIRPLQQSAAKPQTALKRQLEVASVGSGGVQRSSSQKVLNARYRDELVRGGWSEEDIKNIESNL